MLSWPKVAMELLGQLIPRVNIAQDPAIAHFDLGDAMRNAPHYSPRTTLADSQQFAPRFARKERRMPAMLVERRHHDRRAEASRAIKNGQYTLERHERKIDRPEQRADGG
jgi:hypothetical protein